MADPDCLVFEIDQGRVSPIGLAAKPRAGSLIFLKHLKDSLRGFNYAVRSTLLHKAVFSETSGRLSAFGAKRTSGATRSRPQGHQHPPI
jgi:hypothetical protein